MKKNILSIATIQMNVRWEDIPRNINRLKGFLKKIKTDVDLLVLPEMWTTGFSMNTKLAETMNGLGVSTMRVIAREFKIVVCGSLMIRERGKFYNRLIWMQPDGKYLTYDKRHLFGLGGEQKHFSPGKKILSIELNGWKIRPMICYDLRFPVWSRNSDGYDLLIYVASWPKKRIVAWDTLLKARAIENQSYLIGLSRVGKDGLDVEQSGNSVVLGPLGEVIATESRREKIIYAELKKSDLEKIRKQLPFLKDADEFTLNVK